MNNVFTSKDQYTEFKDISSLTDRDKLAYIEFYLNANIQEYEEELKGSTGLQMVHIEGVIAALKNLRREFFGKNNV